MKAFSLWLFKLCWRREIAREAMLITHPLGQYGADYAEGFRAGIEYTLETLHLKEPK